MDRHSLPTNRQHSIARSVVLHLLPGALITIFYIGAAPVVRDLGFPALMAFYLAIVLVLIPFELGYLLYRARTEDVSLGSVVLYRDPVPRAQLVGLVTATFIWASLIAMLLFPALDQFLTDTFFSWVPAWFFYTEDFAQYSTAVLAITWVFGLLANGIAGPVVEELYFRGYLLPRMEKMKGWAPLVNAVLFSLYHFFAPAGNPSRIAGSIPMAYIVRWKKSIFLSMLAHCLLNTINCLATIPMFFQ